MSGVTRPRPAQAQSHPPSNERDGLWTVQELGEYLRIPVATIYQWRVTGGGPPAVKLGKHLRFEPQVVRDWVSDHRETA